MLITVTDFRGTECLRIEDVEENWWFVLGPVKAKRFVSVYDAGLIDVVRAFAEEHERKKEAKRLEKQDKLKAEGGEG